MARYVYPAIFTREESGMYAVDFPDFDSCYTSGDDLPDAMKMAEDVLALTLYEFERDGKAVPDPSDGKAIATDENEFVNYVSADTLYYTKKYNKKSVKKTLSIPEWMNDLAVAANINFSQTLQDALAKKLQIKL